MKKRISNITVEVMNLHNSKPTELYDFFIDRRSALGNPFFMPSEGYRKAVIRKHKVFFKNAIKEKSNIHNALKIIIAAGYTHRKVRLFCWCTPKKCHGDTIKKYLFFLFWFL